MISPEHLEMLKSAKQIRRVWVDSRVIRSVGHFSLPGGILTVLEIEQRGKDYRTILQYFGAPQSLAQHLAEADSKAAVFFTKIEGFFPCQKVTADNSIFASPEWRRGEKLPPGVKLKTNQSLAVLWGWGPDSSPGSGESEWHFGSREEADSYEDEYSSSCL